MPSLKPLICYTVSVLSSLSESERASTLTGLEDFVSSLHDGMVRDFFLSPLVSAEDKAEVLHAAKVPGFTKLRGFWSYVFHSKMVGRFEEVVSQIKNDLAKSSGETVGIVRSAQPLSDGQKIELAKSIAVITGARSVRMQEETDATKLAGFTIHVGGTVIEGSFGKKLERIGSAF